MRWSAIKNLILIPLISTSLALSCSCPLWALSLEEAVSFSLVHNPGLSARRSHTMSVGDDVMIATSFHLPNLKLTSKYVKTDSPADVFGLKLNRGEFSASDFDISRLNSPAAFDSYVTKLDLTIPLFYPSVLAKRKGAVKNFESEKLSLSMMEQELSMEVIQAYMTVVTARALKSAALSGYKEALEHLRVAKMLEKSGVGLFADVLRAEVFLAKAEERKISAENGVKLAQLSLRTAMGADETKPLEVEEPPESAFPILPQENFLARAMKQREDLEAMRKKIEAAGAAVSAETSAYLPSIGLFGEVESNGSSLFKNDEDSYKMGVFLNWNLFDGLGREKRVKKMKHLRKSAEEMMIQLMTMVRFQVQKTYLHAMEAKARLSIAKKAERQAGEGLRLVTERYENSLAKMVELLDAQSALDEARAHRITSENDYFISRARLYSSSGELLETLNMDRSMEEDHAAQ